MRNRGSGGVGTLGLLGVAFVVLKLCGVIDWSWWWVTAPFWGPFAAAIAGFSVFAAGVIVAAVVALALDLIDARRKGRR